MRNMETRLDLDPYSELGISENDSLLIYFCYIVTPFPELVDIHHNQHVVANMVGSNIFRGTLAQWQWGINNRKSFLDKYSAANC